ncbi:MAG: hypothetical protein AAFP82_01640 [Bacteroidota bacterium]
MNNREHTEFFLLGTTIVSPLDIDKLALSLNYLVGKGKWNFDLEDRDRVLRLRCSREKKEDVISYLKLNGIFKLEFQYLQAEMTTENKELNYSSGSDYHLYALPPILSTSVRNSC